MPNGVSDIKKGTVRPGFHSANELVIYLKEQLDKITRDNKIPQKQEKLCPVFGRLWLKRQVVTGPDVFLIFFVFFVKVWKLYET